MKKRQAIAALVVAMLLSPVVLSIGVIVAIPLVLVLLPVLLILSIAALPAIVVSLARAGVPAPAQAAEQAVATQLPTACVLCPR